MKQWKELNSKYPIDFSGFFLKIVNLHETLNFSDEKNKSHFLNTQASEMKGEKICFVIVVSIFPQYFPAYLK